MTTDRLRTTPRQAIVLIALLRQSDALHLAGGRHDLAEAICQCALLDAVRGLAGLNGVTITAVVERAAEVRSVQALVPPGVDLLPLERTVTTVGERIGWALQSHLDRAFERVVAVTCCGPPVPARTVATALGTLASADLVIGSTPSGGCYLLGASSDRAVRIIASTVTSDLAADKFRTRAALENLTVRSMEVRPGFADLADVAVVRDALRRVDIPAPCLDQLLAMIAAES